MNTKSLGLSRDETLRLIEIRRRIEEDGDFPYEEAERQAMEVFSGHSNSPASLAFVAVHVCTSDDFGWYDEEDWRAAGISLQKGATERDIREMLGQISQEKGSIFPERKVRFFHRQVVLGVGV